MLQAGWLNDASPSMPPGLKSSVQLLQQVVESLHATPSFVLVTIIMGSGFVPRGKPLRSIPAF